MSTEKVETVNVGSDSVKTESVDARIQTEQDSNTELARGVGESVMVEEGEGERREESLLLFEGIPNTSLIHAKEDNKVLPSIQHKN